MILNQGAPLGNKDFVHDCYLFLITIDKQRDCTIQIVIKQSPDSTTNQPLGSKNKPIAITLLRLTKVNKQITKGYWE